MRILIVEMIKIRASRLFWIYVIGAPLMTVLVVWMIANGITVDNTSPLDDQPWRLWRATSSIFFTFQLGVFYAFGGMFLVSWQQQEHNDATFKLYELMPADTFNIIQVRFYLYYVSWILLLVVSGLASLLFAEVLFAERFPEHAQSLTLSPVMKRYFVDSYKAVAILSLPLQLFFYSASFQIKKASVSILLYALLCVTSFMNFPRWYFPALAGSGLRMIRNIYSPNALYNYNDLNELYFIAVGYAISFIVVLYYLLLKTKLLSNTHEKT